MLFADDGTRLAPVPEKIAILGMGPTLQDFIHLRLQHPEPGGVVHEVWGMNNVINAVRCDVGFIMDDFVEMLERPYMGNKELGIPPVVFWDKSNPGLMSYLRDGCDIPIVTSKAYKTRYPTSVEYPLRKVMESVFGPRTGFHFSNSTSYAIALAWHLGVKQIHLYGVDFGYPADDPYDRRRYLEAARANVESLLLAGYMGGHFTFHMSARTSLFDTNLGRPFYGYADGRKAVSPEMLVTKSLDEIENDHRTVPADTKSRSPEAPCEAVSAGDGGHAVQAAAAEGDQPGGSEGVSGNVDGSGASLAAAAPPAPATGTGNKRARARGSRNPVHG